MFKVWSECVQTLYASLSGVEKKPSANTLLLEPPLLELLLLEPPWTGENPGRVYSSMSWTLQVVGGITLQNGEKRFGPERRTAAVLTYLALEGATSRSKLAGLLWPEVEERRARNNLVQALRRLKKATDEDLVIGDDALKLTDTLETDIATLNVLAFQSKYQEVLNFTGELLPYDYDDLPEFSDWLLLEREKLANLRREALTSLIKQHEKESKYDTALTYAQALLQLDSVDEETYRLVMRLHYLAGNRAEAMKTFERCKTVLQKELDVEPSLETHKLAADIGFGALELNPTKPKETTLPLSILRPPVLIGREKEWERLETAWSEGKVIFLHGEPGSGKSRLMLDFVSSKGGYILVDPRPGDEAVIYSTHARNVRRFLEKFPKEKLEPWVHTELSRLVPELSPEPPPPMQSETDKLRLFEAVAWLTLRHHALGAKAIVTDDMQFTDTGSLEMGNFLVGKFAPVTTPDALRSMNAYRTGEISAQMEAMIQNLVNTGTAVLIEVKPLDQHEVTELVESLALPQFHDLTERLSNYTGGNPFFILETLKSLLESGDEHPEQFPVSNRVNTLIQKRLDNLHPTSLKLARVAAVAGTDFSIQLAETILNMDALELTESFAELERLQVLQGTAFAHDLIYEATLSGIPAPIKPLLHGRVARWLEATNATPARIAEHYLAAGDEVKAISHLLSAAHRAVAVYNLKEATRLYLQTAHLLEAHGETDRTFDALYSVVNLLVSFDTAHNEHILLKLFSIALSDEQRAKAHLAECKNLTALGRAKDAEQAAQQGLHYARAIQNTFLETELLLMLGQALWNGAKIAESRRTLEQAISLSQAQNDLNNLAWGRFWLGVYLFEDNSFREGNEQLLQAEQLFAALNQPREQMSIISQLAINDIKQGRVREAVNRFLKVQHLLNTLNSIVADHIENQQILAACWLHLADYQSALDCIKDATEKSLATRVSFVGVLHSTQSAIFAELGDFGQARKELHLASSGPTTPRITNSLS
jgi:DNA-binding SARP family transcriptional activator